jgi:hypothetical protein
LASIILGVSLRGQRLENTLKSLVVKEKTKAELEEDLKRTVLELKKKVDKEYTIELEKDKKSNATKELKLQQKQLSKVVKVLDF